MNAYVFALDGMIVVPDVEVIEPVKDHPSTVILRRGGIVVGIIQQSLDGDGVVLADTAPTWFSPRPAQRRRFLGR